VYGWTLYFDDSRESILTAAGDNDCSDPDTTIKDEGGPRQRRTEPRV